MESRTTYRSFFWPILLIGVGVIWLLGNLGIIPALNLWLLLRMWPLILIVIGLDILIGRRSSLAGALIGLGALVVIVAVLVAGPRLGLARDAEIRTERFVEPVGQAVSARIQLDLSSASTRVSALAGRENLIDAEITHMGEMDFRASGDREKTVSLGRRAGTGWSFSFNGFNQQRWEIGLAPDLPLTLVVDGGSGSARLDLAGLNLSELNVERGSGSFTILLPESGEAYQARIEGGSGSLDLSLPAGTPLTLRLSGGSGGQSLALPSGAALRVEVRDSGSGEVRIPSDLDQVEGGDGDEGVWETPNYGGALNPILIVVEDLGSGSVRIR
jgi:hypothetical protein